MAMYSGKSPAAASWLRQPFPAAGAITAPRGAGFHRVEQQKVPARRIERSLQKSTIVGGQLRKMAAQCRAAVVVAGQQMRRHRQAVQGLRQRRVGDVAAGIGEVAGQQAEIGVGMVGQDAVDRQFETGERRTAEQLGVRQGQVQVAELNDLHALATAPG